MVLGLTQMLKKWINFHGWVAVAISFVVSLVVVLPSLDKGPVYYFVLVIFAFLNANGFYKVVNG